MAIRSKPLVDDFYKRQIKIYQIFGLWKLPAHSSQRWRVAYDVHFWHVLVFWLLSFDASCIMQVITNITSMNEIIKVTFIFGSAAAVLVKYLTIKVHSHDYIELFKAMHSNDFLPVNPFEDKIFSKALQLSRTVRNSYSYLSLATLIAILMTQSLLDRTGLPMPTYIPLNLEVTWIFCMVYLYQHLSVSLLCLMNIAFDSLSSSLFIYLSGQLDILSYRLENIGTDPLDSQEFISLQLKDCIRYYLKIIKLARRVESLLSFPMSGQIIFSMFVLIADFYCISFLSGPGAYLNFVKYLIYHFCMLTQIFSLCYYSNEVALNSVELSQALYRSNWIGWSKSNRKLMLLMMMQFDNAIRIKTINRCYSFNLAAFISIVKSSYSYFALLKKINS